MRKKGLIRIFITLLVMYILVCTGVYIFQEKLIFFPEKLIPHASAARLKQHFKNTGTLITLPGQGHNGMADHPAYADAIKGILSR